MILATCEWFKVLLIWLISYLSNDGEEILHFPVETLGDILMLSTCIQETNMPSVIYNLQQHVKMCHCKIHIPHLSSFLLNWFNLSLCLSAVSTLKWQPSLALSPGAPGTESLASPSPRGHTQLDTTRRLTRRGLWHSIDLLKREATEGIPERESICLPNS